MHLTIFNGSQKTGITNTEILVAGFVDGFSAIPGNTYTAYKLNSFKDLTEAVALFKDSDHILLAFPLYNYSMPAVVKDFIERLEPLKGKCTGKKVGFLVQYGFPEAVHARPLEKYLEHLSSLLDCAYLGTIIKGGCDSLAKSSKSRNKHIIAGISMIGRAFGTDGMLDRHLLKNYSKPETQTLLSKLFMRVFVLLANRYYWGAVLRKNGVEATSFARPYSDQQN
ncbi:MAG: hypothetical protein A2X28_07145 [Elusimicrobia bacterium GWA2_56_46]|nr:MAG: hypothetical protein A2X28_07145 [Elusimicrobia bacterium GWA2_56_46]OGR54779.1 MAG: hypothetical protein A2X39_10845 [Elusimicrobia bacterium GWC2_56_31]HBB67385.1 hypothetical protein [Elusimicrobiota bacterium]HBW23430.1 hypothetical protein [Elusimicrobiota bacterium]